MGLLTGAVGKVLKVAFGLAMVLLIVGIGAGIYGIFELGARPSSSPDPVDIRIKPGESFADIAEDLHKAGVIRNTVVFRVLAKARSAENKVQAGDYTLRKNMTPDEVLTALAKSRLLDVTVTIPENLRLEEIADILAQKGVVDRDKFLTLARSGTFDFAFLADKPADASIEGYLFPETYKVPPYYDERDIIVMMLRQFDKEFPQQWRDLAKSKGLTIHQIVTMASLIGREARVDDERPVIASVFYNRLRDGMPLQTDPTIQYAKATNDAKSAGTTFKKWWPATLTKADLDIESSYNTYKLTGLPPGPICAPGVASIEAALKPAQTAFKYFVARGDKEGTHAFAATYEEHKQNVEKYQGN